VIAANDIGKLSRRARLTRRPLNNQEIDDVEHNRRTYWSPERRAEGLGVESAIQIAA